jgi:hypothetical protein
MPLSFVGSKFYGIDLGERGWSGAEQISEAGELGMEESRTNS